MNTTTYDMIGSYQFTDSNIGQPDGTIFINSAAHEQVKGSFILQRKRYRFQMGS